jgi:hypothetical protein
MLQLFQRSSSSRRTRSLGAIAFAVAFLVSACGASSTPSVAADPAAACAASDELQTSVDSLHALDLTTVSNDDLKASIDAVSVAATSVIQAAPGGLDQEATSLEGAVNDLQAAYDEAAAGTISDSADAIDTAIVAVKAQSAAMETALAPNCP